MAENIVVIGAGRSTTSLINYLLKHALEFDWNITIADRDLELVQQKAGNHPRARAITINVTNEIERVRAISKADIVISMLPAHMHIPLAKDCIALASTWLRQVISVMKCVP
jgi:saccharopine dehydrogenase-like NADP-dependent oxidoreductase